MEGQDRAGCHGRAISRPGRKNRREQPGGLDSFCKPIEWLLAVRFPYDSSAAYPDGGASVECWTESPEAVSPVPIRSPGFLLEAEVLGPLHTLQPGQQSHLSLEWALAYCPGPILNVNAVGVTHQPFSVQVVNGWAQVRGIFGCFETGHVALTWLDGVGQQLHQMILQPVSPLSVLQIDSIVFLATPIDRAVCAALIILRTDGSDLGQLAITKIEVAYTAELKKNALK